MIIEAIWVTGTFYIFIGIIYSFCAGVLMLSNRFHPEQKIPFKLKEINYIFPKQTAVAA